MSINPAEAVALPELRRRLGRWGENWRTFRMAAWLGWQIESNWTDPFLFLIYSVVKPLSQSLILIVMYFVVNGGGTGEGLFPFIFVGNTFFMYVMAILFGLSFVVIEDREYYQMIKYIYTSTAHIFWYLFGRAVTKFALTTVSVLILLLFGTLILGVPISLARVDHPLFFIVLTMGVISSAALGILLSGVMLVTARHGGMASESLGGLFYFLSGVVFPLEVLPGWLQPVARLMPYSYWLEGLRRALLPGHSDSFFAGIGNRELLTILGLTTLGMTILGFGIFYYLERLAKSRGLIDMITEH